MEIKLPSDSSRADGIWRPRPYQRPFWNYMQKGGKRSIEIGHRRSGKDEICLAWTAVAMHKRVGSYWHMLPEAAQARKAIWDAVDPHRASRRIDLAFPEPLRKKVRNSDMFIEFKVGSTWQVVGSDNFNSLVGSPPVGVVFSEWALSDPLAWAYLKPIIEENGGWAIFVTTVRGENHATAMYQAALQDPTWHTALLTPSRTKLLSQGELRKIKEDYVSSFGEAVGNALFEQEYMCSFEAAILGAVYGKEMREAREEGRICSVPYDPSMPVETWWDIGYRDPVAIWFMQRDKGLIRAIDYYVNNLEGLSHYAKILQDKGYVYSRHLFPHDAAKGEFGSGITISEQASKLGIKPTVMPLSSLEGGINVTRNTLRKTIFDNKRCKLGLEALSQYHYEWSAKIKVFSSKPLHDWASHGADAYRTGAMWTPKRNNRGYKVPKVNIL